MATVASPVEDTNPAFSGTDESDGPRSGSSFYAVSAVGEDSIDLPTMQFRTELFTPIESLSAKYNFQDERERTEYYLGGGSFGDVFKARHKVHDWVAVKLAKPEQKDRIKMYTKEIEKHGRAILGDHVVSIKGFLQEDELGLFGIVMEYMEHGSLWHFRVERYGDVPPWPVTMDMVHKMARGMRFLHSQGIIHRDLKLENVLVSGSYSVKIADLGLATDPSTSAGAGVDCGTDSHKPPEAFSPNVNVRNIVTTKYDVYSFALTIYELLTGLHPYSDRGFKMLCLLKYDLKKAPPLELITCNPPLELQKLMERSWSFEPNDRPEFTAIVRDLESIQSSEAEKLWAINKMNEKIGGLLQPTRTDPNPSNPLTVDSTGSVRSVTEGIKNITVEDRGTSKPFRPLISCEEGLLPSGMNASSNSSASSMSFLGSGSGSEGIGEAYLPLSPREGGQPNLHAAHTGDLNSSSVNHPSTSQYPQTFSQPSGGSASSTLQLTTQVHSDESTISASHHSIGVEDCGNYGFSYDPRSTLDPLPGLSSTPPEMPAASSLSAEDSLISFDSSSPSANAFDINLTLKLGVKTFSVIVSKSQEVNSLMARCKSREWWEGSKMSLAPSLFSAPNPAVTLVKIQLPWQPLTDEFVLTLRVADKDGLLKLWMSYEDGKLSSLSLACFTDHQLDQACKPTVPEISIGSWREQYGKGLEHFDKKAKKSSQKQRRSKRRKDKGIDPVDMGQKTGGGVHIKKGNIDIKMDHLPGNIHIGDQVNNYTYNYNGQGQAESRAPSTSKPSRGKQQRFASLKPELDSDLTESTMKVPETLIMDLSDELRGDEVRILGRRLGLRDPLIENILYRYQSERASEQGYQIIKEWVYREGSRATKKALARALWDTRCYEVARKVR